MSEERRAAPGTAEASVVAPDLVGPVGDDVSSIDGDTSAVRAAARDSSPARRRGRMTLRIPDDEVARPQFESTEPPSVRAVPRPAPTPEPTAAVLTPMRIISIEPDPRQVPPPPDSDVGPVLVAIEEGWLATSGALDDGADGADVEVVSNIQIDGAVSESEPPAAMVGPGEPSSGAVLPAAPSTLRALADDGDDEEIRFDDDVPTPALPRVEAAPDAGERRSDPGDAPEIAAEDMVAVESAPPVRVALDIPPMRARLPSQPGVELPPMRPPGMSTQPIPPPGTSTQPIPPPAAKPAPAVPAPPLRTPLVIVPPHVGNMGPQAAESMGPRRKGRLWWEDLFNDDYVRTMEKLSDAQIAQEVDFIETSLGLERGGAMLDLACGTGRQAIELARRGYEVVAFDLSLQMLARAGDDAQELSAKLNFVQGDMREMTFAEQFDGVYCWNTSFGYFDEEKNANVIDRVHGALKKGGLFLLDVVNRDFIVRQSPSLAWFEGDGCVCMDEMTVDFITSRMKVKRTLMLDDGRSRETEYSMRVYSLHELGKLLHEHGFKVCEVSGRVATPGVFFGNESPRTIILAEKR
jgi:SAM-dependent methyltransferase